MINNIKDYIKKNKFTISLFVIIFILFYFISDVITMYFDDYGNASLSYGYLVKDVPGTHYTISQLLEWSNFIYNNWGGRILYAIAFIIPLLRHGIKAYMFVQSFVMTGIIFYIYKIIKYYCKDKKYIELIPIILIILYNLIDMVYLRHGIYWASASVLYIWPLLPLFALIYLYIIVCEKIKDNKKYNYIFNLLLLIVLSFFTTFSQEQIGVGLLTFQLSYIIFHHLGDFKKYLKIDAPLFITTLISYIALFFAPGNWKRMDSNVDFSNLSIVGKVVRNYPRIMRNIFVDEMNIFIILLAILLLYVIYNVFKNNKNKIIKYVLIPVSFIINIIMIYIIKYKIVLFNNGAIICLLGTVWLIMFFVCSLLYFNKDNKIEFCSLLICGFFTIICLLMSPVTGGRTCLPFIFFVILLDS